MVTHMKTTIDISDALLAQARKVATREKTTLKELVERSLRLLLANGKTPKKPFRLKDRSVGGKGVQPPLREGDWSQIRSLIYEGRGG